MSRQRSAGQVSSSALSALVVLLAIAVAAVLFTFGVVSVPGKPPDPTPPGGKANPPTVAPRKPCTINVACQPDGAYVYYQAPDAKPIYLGKTPLASEIRPGSYQIIVFKDGALEQRPVQIVEDKPCRIEFDLTGADDGTVLVPGGWFSRGCDHGREDERPTKRIWVDAFHIDRHEVSNFRYSLFLAYMQKTRDYSLRSPEEGTDGVREPTNTDVRSGDNTGGFFEPNQPICSVDWYDAYHYAAWAGKRLPTEAEWEMAASWDFDKKVKLDFPWGNSLEDLEKKANVNNPRGRTLPVDALPDGRSPVGCMHMAGNVAEWVNDWYDWFYYPDAPVKNPPGPDFLSEADAKVADRDPIINKAVRGGSGNFFRRLNSEQNRYATYARNEFSPRFRDPNIGFRCARSAAAPPPEGAEK